jgi:hypothetical protein
LQKAKQLKNLKSLKIKEDITMKKNLCIVVALLLTCYFQLSTAFGQSPNGMSYQAVIRDASDNLVTSQTVGMQISILQGTANGTPVYVETQTPTTNANGLVSVEIGAGTLVSGDFSTIDWANGPYFIKTETDPAGGTSYSITGTSQLLSVPYALYAKTAEAVSGGISETDPTFSSSQAANIDATDITNLGNLSGVNTGDQDLSNLATKTALGDSTAQVRNEIPDVSGFLTSETDPIYTSSEAANIDATDITNLSNLSGVNTGDQDLSTLATKTALGDSTAQVRSEIPDVSGFLTSETDPTFTSSQAANIDATDITNLSNLSGVNTGDQDLSNLATKTALGDSTAQVRSEIPDVSGFLTSETDPTFSSSQAANIDATDITNLSNLSGVNTGDQDLSNLATKTALGDSTAQVRSEIPDVSGFLTSETDPTFTSSEAANITATDITNLSNLSGVNTGDQDISGIATNTQAIQDTASQIRADIPTVTTYSVGDFAQGGIVFWVDETGQHGLVCAKTDQSTGVRWYAGTFGGTQAKGDGPYAGEANTSIIIAAQVAIGDDGSTYAARICNELQITEGGKTYGDWYLPSKEELNLMYQNKATIDATAGANGGGSFASTNYWSSTEFDNNRGWFLTFGNGNQANYYKQYTFSVRAVRAF